MRIALALALLALAVAAPAAQPATPTERGLEAYSEGRFGDAVRLLGQAVAASPGDAEAHYLLARVLYDEDNPARDERRAGHEIEAALALEPDNVVYLVAQLEQFRADTWNLLQEIYRARRRREIAQHLLTIDSTNAFAHEELGVQAIVDFYQYRNALKFQGLEFRDPGVTGQEDGADASTLDNELGTVGVATIEAADAGVTGDPGAALDGRFGEEIADRFDINELRRRGVAVTDFAPRAAASYETAVYHLRRSLQSDPRRRPVYDHSVRLATLAGQYEDALPDLAEMYVHFPEDAGMWLYTGMVNHRLGNYEAADVAFSQALEFMDDETREAFTDLTLILPPGEWRAFRDDPEGFANRYWTSRDPRFLNEVNERKTEHYARLVTAELLYRSEDLDIAGWDTERGRLHVRYGLPETDVVIEGGFGAVVEQFAGRSGGFAIDEVDAGLQAANRFNVWDYGDGVRFVFEDPGRNGQFRLYSPPADVFALAGTRNPGAMDFVERAQAEVRRQPERYQFEAPGRQVQLPFRVAAFKGDAGRTDLYVNYGIPVAAAPDADTAVQEDVDVTVKTGAFLIGPGRDLLIERRRTVYGLRGAQIVPFEQTRLWTSTEPLTAVPGDGYQVSLEFETASGGTSAVQRRDVDVPDFSGDRLALSDVLLAYDAQEADAAVPGRVFRDGVSVQPAPWGVFGVGDPIYLFFEAYGLGQTDGRTDYEVEASLRPKDTARGLRRLARRVFGGDGTAVSSAFEVQGDRPDDTVYLFLDATGQEPGLYTLTVTVRDRVSGTEAERETDLLLE
ncbi:GWxTD domain-containing protein [Rubrivirga sp. IMCC45206]|uniref:GWxTD domain-containing protein n=1 Tax=Rubrivirga sp. IMCC45206 TaxID=3391614 RepID=UPI0039901709